MPERSVVLCVGVMLAICFGGGRVAQGRSAPGAGADGKDPPREEMPRPEEPPAGVPDRPAETTPPGDSATGGPARPGEIARPAPNGCQDTAVKQIEKISDEAMEEIILKQTMSAWRKVVEAIKIAKQNDCQQHRSLSKAYMVLATIEYYNSRDLRMAEAFRNALRLDPKVQLPKEIMASDLHHAFYRVRQAILARTDPARRGSNALPEAGGGCRTDHDCKGTRICHAGRCLYPGGRRTRANTMEAPPVVAEASAPVVPRVHRFGQAGTVEIGGTVSVSYQKTTVVAPDDGWGNAYEMKGSTTRFGVNAYIGYFVTSRFVLGVLFALPISSEKMEGVSDATVSWELDLVAAPGFAVPISQSVFLFGDALIGFATTKSSDGTSSSRMSLGFFGAELGLKVVLGVNYLLRVGIQPSYLVGNGRVDSLKVDGNDVRVFLTLGFSGFL